MSWRTVYWIAIAMLGFMLISRCSSFSPQETQEIPFSDFKAMVWRNEINSATIIKNEQGVWEYIDAVSKDKQRFATKTPANDAELIRLFEEKNITYAFVSPSGWRPSLPTLILILFFVGLYIFIFRRMRGMGGGNSGIFSFGRSKAKIFLPNENKTTFKDIAGIEEAKEEVSDIIDFLRNPQQFTRLGGRVPKGVLLVGPPGTGKTLLARAVAGEANVPFFSVSGSEFVEMFVGVGAARVRDLFLQAKNMAPCIIFLDEVDAVAKSRGAAAGIGGHDERDQTLQQLLTEMDGFEAKLGIIILAATNRVDVLDPAFLRPGRFDRHVYVPLPDIKGREAILEIHAAKITVAPDVNLSIIARGTPGLSGADLENIVNEAALAAGKKKREAVTAEDFEEAKDKIIMGTARKSMVMSEKEKRITAYHEAGHALVAKLIKGTDPIYKVSIIPRGMALGITQQLPETDRHGYSKEELLAVLAVLYGGRAAEEIILNAESTGAQNDFQKATEIAEKMVKEFGMSELGPMTFGKRETGNFIGFQFIPSEHSENFKQKVDEEIKKIVDAQYSLAKKLLEENKQLLHKIVEILLEKETIDGAEIDEIMKKPRN